MQEKTLSNLYLQFCKVCKAEADEHSSDAIDFERAVKYQAAVVALQMFLQHYITRDYTVVYDDIIVFYLRHCKTVADFLAYRTVLKIHEDDERDGSEDDTPLTCGRTQEVFEHIEEFMFSRKKVVSDNMLHDIKAVELLATSEFKAVVDSAFHRLQDPFDSTVLYIMEKLFSKQTLDTDLTKDAAKCIVRASVLGTSSFYDVYGNEKKDWDQFYFILNDACDITEVGFASYDDFDTDDIDIFIDRVIVCRTDNDWRLRGFYDYATEYIKDALDLDRCVENDKIVYRNSI